MYVQVSMSKIKKDYFSSRREMQPAGKRNKAFPFKKQLDWESSCTFNILNSCRSKKRRKKKRKSQTALRSLQTKSVKAMKAYLPRAWALAI